MKKILFLFFIASYPIMALDQNDEKNKWIARSYVTAERYVAHAAHHIKEHQSSIKLGVEIGLTYWATLWFSLIAHKVGQAVTTSCFDRNSVKALFFGGHPTKKEVADALKQSKPTVKIKGFFPFSGSMIVDYKNKVSKSAKITTLAAGPLTGSGIALSLFYLSQKLSHETESNLIPHGLSIATLSAAIANYEHLFALKKGSNGSLIAQTLKVSPLKYNMGVLLATINLIIGYQLGINAKPQN